MADRAVETAGEAAAALLAALDARDDAGALPQELREAREVFGLAAARSSIRTAPARPTLRSRTAVSPPSATSPRAAAADAVDVRGLHLLPGVVDSQVHLREPGNEHKEDLESGGRAAALGGVTAVFEMPNTKPPTTTPEALADKVARARHRMYCDFAFYGGATTENVDILADIEREPGCCGIKIFMGSSTGNLLVDKDADVLRVLKAIKRRAAVHSEDEFRLRERRELALLGHVETHHVWRDAEAAVLCTTRLLRLARDAGKRIHVLHVSTADEIPILAAAKDIATDGADAATPDAGRRRGL